MNFNNTTDGLFTGTGPLCIKLDTVIDEIVIIHAPLQCVGHCYNTGSSMRFRENSLAILTYGVRMNFWRNIRTH